MYIHVKNFLIPKYMSKQTGRPTLPEGRAKDVQIGVRFTPKQDEQIEKAIIKSGSIRAKTEWIREAAIEKAKEWEKRPPVDADLFWGQLPYPEKELHKKTVEFRLIVKWENLEKPVLTTGTGKFFIRYSRKGSHVQIISQITPQTEKVIDLTSEQAKLIKRQPEDSKFDFSLVATQF